MVALEGSGKISTRRPLARRYSVIPSTLVTFSGAGGADFAACVVVAGWEDAGLLIGLVVF
jgi:hypothetical protein